jgi:hypothetical protein
MKRNLLIFVTPTIIKQGYGTGLESQVSGLNHSGEEYADPNGWRNNAKAPSARSPHRSGRSQPTCRNPGVCESSGKDRL